MNSIIDELIDHVSKSPKGVESVYVGQRYIVVRLDSKSIGLALTPINRFDPCIGLSKLSGSLTKYDSSELTKFCRSKNAHLRAIGLATINSILQEEVKEKQNFLEGDFLRFIEIKKEDNVATIDYFTTKIGSLKKANLTVFDDRFAGKRKDFRILPMSSLRDEISKADVVIMPPTIIDKIDEVTKLATNAREFIVAGPTTPPLPKPFFKRGVTMVASMLVLDPDSVLRYVIEGAGTTMFKKFCMKVVFKKKRPINVFKTWELS